MAERTCIATGQTLPREKLIRIVAGPDGFAIADLAEKLPGRGVWVAASRQSLERAQAKGLIKRAIGVGLADSDESIDQIGSLLRARALAAASMARRAGALLGGAGKLAAEGRFAGLLAAPDASPRECQKLAAKLGVQWTSHVFDAAELGQICGRPTLTFAAIRGGEMAALAEKLQRELDRLAGFYASSGCQAG